MSSNNAVELNFVRQERLSQQSMQPDFHQKYWNEEQRS